MTTTTSSGQPVNLDDPVARFHYDAHAGRKAVYTRDSEAAEKAVKDLPLSLLDTFMKAGQGFKQKPLATIFMLSMTMFNAAKQLGDRLDFMGKAPPSDAQFLRDMEDYRATGQWPGQQGPAAP